jgi:GntR family transcriptional regulator
VNIETALAATIRNEGIVRAGIRDMLSEANGPLYLSISNLLRTEIAAGKIPPGGKLPTIDQFANDFGVARVTVRQALGVLAEEGLVVSVQGRGTFAAATPRPQKTLLLQSNWQQLLAIIEGNQPRLLECRDNVRELPAAPDDGRSAGAYRYMKRVHCCDREPYCVIEIFLDQEIYETAPNKFDRQMVIPLLHTIEGLRLKRIQQTFQVGMADLATASLIHVKPNAPIGVVRRVITDRSDRIIYFGRGHYCGDYVVFQTAIDLPGVLRKSTNAAKRTKR